MAVKRIVELNYSEKYKQSNEYKGDELLSYLENVTEEAYYTVKDLRRKFEREADLNNDISDELLLKIKSMYDDYRGGCKVAVTKVRESKRIKESRGSDPYYRQEFEEEVKPKLAVHSGPGYLNISGASVGVMLGRLIKFLTELDSETENDRKSTMLKYAEDQISALEEDLSNLESDINILQEGITSAKSVVNRISEDIGYGVI